MEPDYQNQFIFQGCYGGHYKEMYQKWTEPPWCIKELRTCLDVRAALAAKK